MKLKPYIMKAQKAPLSIRIIYWLSTFSLIMLSLIVLAVLIFNILLPFGIFDHDLQLHTQFPVKVDFLEVGNLSIKNQNVDVELVNASSQIHFINTPNFITNKIAPFLLIVVSAGWYLTFIFRKLIMSVKDGNPFTIDNIKILKHIAYGVAGLWLFTLIYLRLFYYFIVTNVTFENIKISSEFIDLDGILFGAIFIWILAHIFETGLKLQEDKDLTI